MFILIVINKYYKKQFIIINISNLGMIFTRTDR